MNAMKNTAHGMRIADHTGTAVMVWMAPADDGWRITIDERRNRADLPEYYFAASGQGETQNEAIASFVASLRELASA